MKTTTTMSRMTSPPSTEVSGPSFMRGHSNSIRAIIHHCGAPASNDNRTHAIVVAVLLILMRHGEAGEADSRRWPTTAAPAYRTREARDTRGVADALRRMGVRFERLLSSPLVARARDRGDHRAGIWRARSGADRAARGQTRPGPRRSRAWPRAMVSALLCVGPEPTLSRLAGLLTRRDGSAAYRDGPRRAGSAVIDVPGPGWRQGHGLLRLHLRPPRARRPARRRARPTRRPHRPIRSSRYEPRTSGAPRSRARSTWTSSAPSGRARARCRRCRALRGLGPRHCASSVTTSPQLDFS